MIGLEYLLFAGGALLFVYGFTAACSFLFLWERVRPRGLRDTLVKLAASLCWPYAVWRACAETAPEPPPMPGRMSAADVDRRMRLFCAECKWCNLGYGLGTNNTYPGCVDTGADCGWFYTCEGPDGCLAEFKRLGGERC